MGFNSDTVDLRHLPPRGWGLRRKVYFRLLSPFRYTPPRGGSTLVPKHESPPDSGTDLASVPSPLWGLIASYGRQTQPALLHDHMCVEARKIGDLSAKTKFRRDADWLFWQALRDQGVGPVERSLMWAAVRFQGLLEFEKAWLLAYVMVAATGVLVVWTSLGLPVGWSYALPARALAVLVVILLLFKRWDIAGAGLIAAPGLYVAVPVGLVNVVGLVLLWIPSRIVYVLVAASRRVLSRIYRLVEARWEWLGRVVAALNREQPPEIGPTNSL